MRFGVCYYPEQWPEARWAADARQMAEAGLDLVRIGEFAWSTFEPERGRFEWDWLDRATDVLADAGLAVVMCTPTATPPVWLARERPEILSVGPDGRRRAYGSRRHTCVTSEAYREEAERIVAALGDRYGRHPAIVAWQVDNETGNHDSARCWCGECQAAFTAWLERRFGTIDALNEAWGTAFWSQTYPDFEAVRLPVPAMTTHHPALRLAHLRFASEQTLDFVAVQFAVLRERVGDGVDLTTNFYCEDLAVDQRAAARLTGLAAIDSYPHGPDDPTVTAYHLDLARGATGRAWIMEQQAGPINWTPRNPPVPDGQVRLWTWQAALHGIEAVLYFRWRAARFGQEMYHSGLLRQDGSPTAAVAEIAATIRELRLDPPPPPKPRVALLHSYDDVWAIDVNPHQAGLTHRALHLPAYAAAGRLGLDVAIVAPTDDLTGYELVLAPALHIATPQRLAALEQAMAAGARVVLGPRSLVVDAESAWSDQPLPAGLAERLGARVVEHLSQTLPVTVEPWGTAAGPWTDVLEVGGADVLATYGGGTHLDGRPAAVAGGGLIYAGFSDAAAWTALLAELRGEEPEPAGVEVFRRGDAEYRLDHDALTVGWRSRA